MIVRVASTGNAGEAVHELPGGVALAFRPGTRTLTVAVTTHPASGAFDELWAIDLAAGGDAQLLPAPSLRQRLLGSFRREARLRRSLQHGRQLRFPARARGHREFLGASPPFAPSPDYQTLAGFFDQYGQSHRLWAPTAPPSSAAAASSPTLQPLHSATAHETPSSSGAPNGAPPSSASARVASASSPACGWIRSR